jgi:hypothetical protein
MKYNLKFSVGCLIVTLAVMPFIYFHLRANDIIDFFDRRFDTLEVLLASLLPLPILLLISFNLKFARCCSRDVGRVAETMAAAKYVSCLVTLILLISLAVLIL